MPLLNYTTSVNASKTAGEMQAALVKAGAAHVSSTYENGSVTGLMFTIGTPLGPRTFALPVNASAVQAVLRKQGVPQKFRTPEQAERVAWRILKDWLLAQLAIIATEMVTLDQVMLPYMTDATGATVYDLYAKQQLALGAGDSEG